MSTSANQNHARWAAHQRKVARDNDSTSSDEDVESDEEDDDSDEYDQDSRRPAAARDTAQAPIANHSRSMRGTASTTTVASPNGARVTTSGPSYHTRSTISSPNAGPSYRASTTAHSSRLAGSSAQAPQSAGTKAAAPSTNATSVRYSPGTVSSPRVTGDLSRLSIKDTPASTSTSIPESLSTNSSKDISKFTAYLKLGERRVCMEGKYDTGADDNMISKELVNRANVDHLIKDASDVQYYQGPKYSRYKPCGKMYLEWVNAKTQQQYGDWFFVMEGLPYHWILGLGFILRERIFISPLDDGHQVPSSSSSVRSLLPLMRVPPSKDERKKAESRQRAQAIGAEVLQQFQQAEKAASRARERHEGDGQTIVNLVYPGVFTTLLNYGYDGKEAVDIMASALQRSTIRSLEECKQLVLQKLTAVGIRVSTPET